MASMLDWILFLLVTLWPPGCRRAGKQRLAYQVFACFHAVSLECSRFRDIAIVVLKLLEQIIGCPLACSGRKAADRLTQTKYFHAFALRINNYMTFDDINHEIAGPQPICAHAVALCRCVFCPKLDRQRQLSLPSCFPSFPFFIFFSPLFTHPSCLGISSKVRHLFQAVVIPCKQWQGYY